MPGNSNLHDSSRNKQDEFYTNLQLIEDELKHYRVHFKGKRVLCNCDDPYESNFFKYFAMSFNSLGLKSLTATCYATSPVVYTQLNLFGADEQVARKGRKGAQGGKQPYKIVINEVTDVNGNITRYIDSTGNTFATYIYDAFGNIIAQSGDLADFFRHRFSTKYFDAETGLSYYGYRFYHPVLMRWLTRDPLEEDGGVNLYQFCRNRSTDKIDYLGLYLWYVLYYDQNQSRNNFRRAAETCKRNIEKTSTFNPNCDAVEMYSIRTTNDFFNVWNTLNAHSRRKSKRVTRYQVKGLYLYTHSGPGQLFLRGSTAYSYQIKRRPTLNWAQKAEIQCLGCNSGVENGSGDSLAGSFYESQGVPTLGQAAASSFSIDPNEKSKWGVVLGFSEVYLWAFDADDNRIPPVRYPNP